MKKLLVVLVVLGAVAFGFGAMSSKKECQCQDYDHGEKAGEALKYEVKSSEDCTTWMTYDEATKTGVKCVQK